MIRATPDTDSLTSQIEVISLRTGNDLKKKKKLFGQLRFSKLFRFRIRERLNLSPLFFISSTVRSTVSRTLPDLSPLQYEVLLVGPYPNYLSVIVVVGFLSG